MICAGGHVVGLSYTWNYLLPMAKPSRAPSRTPRTPRYVTREEYDAILATFAERAELIANLERTCAIQFERIAQMQVQLDHLERRFGSTRR